jgi:hypothetical protein
MFFASEAFAPTVAPSTNAPTKYSRGTIWWLSQKGAET